MKRLTLLIGLVLLVGISPLKNYTEDWKSLDSRPLPDWFDKAKFGIFIHWGVFSVPSYGCSTYSSEWYWKALESGSNCTIDYHKKTYGADFKYADFAKSFTADLFDPNHWADTFANSGAKYVVLTSKHHEGYTLWPSAQSWNWNSFDVGPHKDLVGLLTDAVRAKGLKMGLYHSLYDWFNPIYLADAKAQGKTTVYTDTILMPMLKDIVNTYKPEVIWADGDWDQTSDYWKSRQFFAWLFNDSPVRETVVVNDRWGKDTEGKHGSYFTGGDRYDPSHLVKRKWENCYTIDKDSWGFARNHNLDQYYTSKELIYTLIRNVAFGGNLLLNVGPALDGTIPIVFQDRLRDIGKWLSVNGEAIYETHPWRVQNQTQPEGFMGYFTLSPSGDAVYYIIQGWPSNSIITLPQPEPVGLSAEVHILGWDHNLQFNHRPGKLEIALPPINYVNSRDAYTIKLIHFK